VLDPDVVLRADGGAAPNRPSVTVRGARKVAEQASFATRLARFVRPALINGTPGAVVVTGGQVFSVMSFTVAGGRIATIEVLYDPARVAGLDLTVLDETVGGTA
jgi:RNA polymerase sigma-70 factor (ECF subfamily)